MMIWNTWSAKWAASQFWAAFSQLARRPIWAGRADLGRTRTTLMEGKKFRVHATVKHFLRRCETAKLFLPPSVFQKKNCVPKMVPPCSRFQTNCGTYGTICGTVPPMGGTVERSTIHEGKAWQASKQKSLIVRSGIWTHAHIGGPI